MRISIGLIPLLLLSSAVMAFDKECLSDGDCSSDQVCVWNDCESLKIFCSSDADCDSMETCEEQCVLWDFNTQQCGRHARACRFNPQQVEPTPECYAFCSRLAPCYDHPSTSTMQVCEIDGECEDPVSEQDYHKDKSLSCRLDCSEWVAGPEPLASNFAALVNCGLQTSLGTCGDVFDECNEEALACFGPGVLSGSGFMDTKKNSSSLLASGGGGSGGCSASSAERRHGGFFLLFMVGFVALLGWLRRRGLTRCL